MIVLALDLATNTGFCWGPADGRPRLGHERLPSTGEDVGMFLCAFEDWFRPVLESSGADVVVFEAPVLPRPKFNPVKKRVEGGVSIQTTRKLQGLAGLVEMIAHREGLPCFEAQPAEAKIALTGKGNAKKHEMVEAARGYGFKPHTYIVDGKPASDEADALAVWLSFIRVRFPEIGNNWSPLFTTKIGHERDGVDIRIEPLSPQVAR